MKSKIIVMKNLKSFIINFFVILCFVVKPISGNTHTSFIPKKDALHYRVVESLELEEDAIFEVVEHTTSCTIVKVYDKEKKVWLFNVIAAVLTSLLPEVAEGICMRTIGDSDICSAVHSVTSALVTLRGYIGKTSMLGRTGQLSWKAVRRNVKSRAIIKDIASNAAADAVKTVFSSYEENCQASQGIPWESIEENNNFTLPNIYEIGQNTIGAKQSEFVIANLTNNNLVFMWKMVNPNEEPENWAEEDWFVEEVGTYTSRPCFSSSNNEGVYYICIHSNNERIYYKVFGKNQYKFTWNHPLSRWELTTI